MSGHYLQLTLFQHDYGYAACLLRDVTNRQIHEGAFNSMVLSYREVYHLQLEDNYCLHIRSIFWLMYTISKSTGSPS